MRILPFTLLLLFAAPAYAQFSGPGADAGPTTVQAILDNPVDDQEVMLRGFILERIDDEDYLFTDGTGRIRVEIDDDEFPREQVTPETEVELLGEVDVDSGSDIEIDVERIGIL